MQAPIMMRRCRSRLPRLIAMKPAVRSRVEVALSTALSAGMSLTCIQFSLKKEEPVGE